MHPDTRQVAEHMKDYSFHLLGKALYDATFSEMTDPFAHTLSVVQAAHGAEILVKARIAQEHPLLIFSTYPKSSSTGDLLGIKELFEKGKTLNYSDLPEVLWATTGYRMKHSDRFKLFGDLRNGLVHFAAPVIDASAETIKFAFEVMDPMAHDFWNDSFVGYAASWDSGAICEGGLPDILKKLKVQVHLGTQTIIKEWE
jgi:hypothetical protein